MNEATWESKLSKNNGENSTNKKKSKKFNASTRNGVVKGKSQFSEYYTSFYHEGNGDYCLFL